MMNNIKNVKTIYLAAAIDLNKSKRDIFSEMADRLGPAICFNPKSAFKNANNGIAECDDYLAYINFDAIKYSDMLVAYVDTSVPTFGVPMEILYAAYLDKPVVIIAKGKLSIYLKLFANKILKDDEDLLNLDYMTIDTIYTAHLHRVSGSRRRRTLVSHIFSKDNFPFVSIPKLLAPSGGTELKEKENE